MATACTSTRGNIAVKRSHKPTPSPTANLVGINKIQHIIVIMQENRSFDSYFGTYPGADGIPFKDGVATVCSPDPRTKTCVRPLHDPYDRNFGGPHVAIDAFRDINDGKMNGFIQSVLDEQCHPCVLDPQAPRCVSSAAGRDVMGYHDQREIPNYWEYARNFVLQDRMFEPNYGWSLPAHLFVVSAWSAHCTQPSRPMTCVSSLANPDKSKRRALPMAGPTSRTCFTSIM